MVEPQNIIHNSQEIIDKIGYWPTFHDDELKRLEYSHKTKELVLEIYCIQQKCSIELKCKSVYMFKIDCHQDQMDGDIIDNLDITALESGDISIKIDPSYGSVIDVMCKKIQAIIKNHE